MPVSKVKTAVNEPDKILPWLGRKVNDAYRQVCGLSQPSDGYNTDGFCIFSEDWDNLILLDACRYDYFKEYIDIPGKLESRISRGSMSREFARGNFHGENRFDTIYISQNGWPVKMKEELGDEYRKVFYSELIPGDPREKGQVRDRCQKLSSRALELQQEYPHKRFILHYMPPHRPYVDTDGNIILIFKHKSIYELKREGIRHEDFKEAYDTTVQYILDHIKPVIKELEGKTVISADHGELLRERMFPIPIRRHGHPSGVYVEELVKVPWFIVDWDERKEIKTETELSGVSESREEKMTTEELDDHLRDLGYKI